MSSAYSADPHSFRGGGYGQGRRPWRNDPVSEADVFLGNTGQRIVDETWTDTEQRRQQTDRRSERLAALLAQAGLQIRTETGLAEVGLVTGAWRKLSAYRSSCLIPVVAQRERAPLIPAFCYFAATSLADNEQLRIMTITAQQPCPAADLRGVMQALHRLGSRWSAEAYRRFGIEALVRVTEYPVSKTGGADRSARRTYHVHMHVLVCCPAEMPDSGDKSLADFVSWSGHRFKAQVHLTDRVHNIEAAIRYHLKPPFSDGRLPESPADALALFDAVHGLKVVQPLQSFAEFLKTLRARNVKIVPRYGRDGVTLVEMEKGRRVRRQADPSVSPSPVRHRNGVITTSFPRPVHSPWLEPSAIVADFDPDTFEPPARVGPVTIGDLQDAWKRHHAPSPQEALAHAAALTASMQPRRGARSGSPQSSLQPPPIHALKPIRVQQRRNQHAPAPAVLDASPQSGNRRPRGSPLHQHSTSEELPCPPS